MDYQKLCDAVVELDSNIRFVGVANNKSQIIAKSSNKDAEKLLSADEVKMSIHYTLDRWEKTSNLSYKIGNERSAVIEYEKVTLITIPLSKSELLLLSTELEARYGDIVRNIREKLKEFQ